MDSAAAAFALDPPAPGPGPPPAPGDCAQARKNFSVSHLLDLEEVAAAGRRAAGPGPGPEAREGAAREPSGGSSGSEAAPQDGECGVGTAGARDSRSRSRVLEKLRLRGSLAAGSTGSGTFSWWSL